MLRGERELERERVVVVEEEKEAAEEMERILQWKRRRLSRKAAARPKGQLDSILI